MKRRLVLAGLAIATLVFANLSWRSLSPGAGSRIAKAESLGAPVLSARRLPDLLVAEAEDAKVRAAVSQAIDQAHLGSAVCVAATRGGRRTVADRVDTPMIPASTLKLLTASTALDALGSGARFSTTVKADAGPKNGVIAGPLYLVGGGDPLLFTADYDALLRDRRDIHTPLETLADNVTRSGVHVIHGGIVADAHRFDSQPFIPSWDPSYLKEGQVGPAGALVVNQGFGRPPLVKQATSEPAVQAAQIFDGLLRARGVTIDHGPILGYAPTKTTTITAAESPPVADIVTEMLTESDNTTAEILIKDIGARAEHQGTTSQGITAVTRNMNNTGVPVAGVTQVDGSGLDRSDRATCRTLDGTINRGGPSGGLAPLMAIAGETGTLAKRMNGTAAVGRIRAKTGTLKEVSGLVGWATPDQGTPTSFAILNNGSDEAASHQFEDRLALIFATLPPPGPTIAYAPDPVEEK